MGPEVTTVCFLASAGYQRQKNTGSEAPGALESELQLEFACDCLVYHSGT